jgi:hypothetical protein
MLYYLLFVILFTKNISIFAFERNCSAIAKLRTKFNYCLKTNISCNIQVYNNEFSKCIITSSIQNTFNFTTIKMISNWLISFKFVNLQLLQNNICVFLQQCKSSCKTKNNTALLNCYENCFTTVYNCKSYNIFIKKPPVLPNKSYGSNIDQLILVGIILSCFALCLIRYTCFYNNYDTFSRKVYTNTFSEV